MVRKIILAILLIVLVTNVAGAESRPYWIDNGVENVYVKTDIPTGETITLYAVHEAGYAPNITNVMDEGLRYSYYDGTAFNTFLGTGIDTNLDHTWSSLVSIEGNAWETQSDTVSIRWEGWVIPDGIGSTTFYTTSDDGQRLYVDEVMIINNWVNQGSTEKSAAIDLQSISTIKYEFYENTGGATARLGWDSVNNAKVYPIPPSFLVCRQNADVSVTVTDMDYYMLVEITNNEASDLTGYQAELNAAELGIVTPIESWSFSTTVPEPPEPPEPEPEPPYDPTLHGRYSKYIDMVFPYDGEKSAWALVANLVTVWTVHVGDDVFWLLVLPLPIMAYWIKTKSVELPTVVYLVLGGVFYGVAPDVMQTPARIMLMFGLAGMLYHFFKNRG